MKVLLSILLLISLAASGDNLSDQLAQNKYLLHERCKVALQEQINLEMHASLVYMQMSAYYGNNKVARKGFSKFFAENSDEEREHAQKIINYINKRGSTVTSFNVNMPTTTTWMGVVDALQYAMALEHKVTNKLHETHKVAEKECKDPQMMDFIEHEFLEEQVDSIDKLQRMTTVIQNMDTGMGEFLMDRELLEGKEF
ncbi:soma ferritin-like [Ornithodoros turicata]|uniref:soma ferritin-like n=1 Tax=Ornithodoros turicata TaxID=34597 RepID=UPI0031386979